MRLIPYTDEHLALSLALEEDPVAMKHIGGPRPREEILKVHPTRVKTSAELGLYLVVAPDDSDEPMGSMGIWETEHNGEKTYEMGWMLLPAFHGRGIATEAGRMLLAKARRNPAIKEVWAFPGQDNAASNAICRKLGFDLVGKSDVSFSGRQLHCNDWRLDMSTLG
ncbi:MAG: GNAT family N-acetyltransferase [Chloroflexota bacterium]